MQMISFKVVRLKNKCLHPLLCSFMRSCVMNTEWNLRFYAVNTTESKWYLLFWWNISSSFSAVMMISSVIITFSFYGNFRLSHCHFPGMSHPDFWLWVDWWCYCGRNILSVVNRSAQSFYMSFKCSHI